MRDFLFKIPTKIIFGEGKALKLSELCTQFKADKVFIVSDPVISNTDAFKEILKSLDKSKVLYQLYLNTIPEPPIEDVDKAADILKDSGCNLVIAVGGGSPIDIAKAICMLKNNNGSVRDYLFGGTKTVEKPSLPLICIPTTAGSGSEVTASSVISDNQNNIKLSVTHEYLTPKIAVIDPVMQIGMPPLITASTGMDALTHAIEAYVSLNSNPISDIYATAAMRLIGDNIRTATYNPNNIEARSNMAIASILAAAAFVNGGLGAVHGISQAMGGVAHVPHGIANSMMLPFVMQLNSVGNIKKFAEIANILDGRVSDLSIRKAAEASVEIAFQLAEDLKIPKTLKEVNVTRDMFPTIVKGTMEYRLLAVNPVKLAEKDIYNILERAY